jgi:isoleucyl-tRNA synthetase
MSTALKNTNPFKTILGFASVRDEKGEEMHKSKGNGIEFNRAAGEIGSDVMRWLYVTQNPEVNLNFGFGPANEVKRKFYLILWNSYKFFIDYALQTGWSPKTEGKDLNLLDKWILAKMEGIILTVNKSLEAYDAATASRAIEDFVVNDFSTWYIRRSRDRVGPLASVEEKNSGFSVMHEVLVKIYKLLAPFMPFISEEMFKNLTGQESVHLADYPETNTKLLNQELIDQMSEVKKLVEIGHAKRKEAMIKVRQPLAEFKVLNSQFIIKDEDLISLIKDELNVKKVSFEKGKGEIAVAFDTNLTQELKDEGEARNIVRGIQQERKKLGTSLDEKVNVTLNKWPSAFEAYIKTKASVGILIKGENFSVSRK